MYKQLAYPFVSTTVIDYFTNAYIEVATLF